jgi:predicted metal-dependent phosphoesterase TrpH
MKTIDLHMHTTASDGSDSVEERVAQADEEGLELIALTDHDVINSDLTERIYVDEETGVTVVTGAEIKCEVQNTGIEILSYFLDPESEEINNLLERNSHLREKRIRDMIGNLNEELDYDLTEDEVFQYVGENPGRPHIARALAEAEEIEDVEVEDDAFDKYIGEDCPAYIPTPKQDAEKVINTVFEEGGVPVLAHPGRDLERAEAEELVGELVDYGLQGIEVMYSWDHKKENGYDINFGEDYSGALAEKFDLVWTGGSDCHGSETDKYLIGSVKVPYSQVEKLAEKADKSCP